jgi:hypothetical protein
MAALAALMAVACVVVAILEIRRTGEILSPLILFLGLSIFDVYLPAVLFALTAPPDLAPWLDRDAVVSALPSAVIVFTVGLVLFVLGYALVHRWPATKTDPVASPAGATRLGALVAGIALLASALWYAWTIGYRSAAIGSLALYVANGLVIRWQPEPLAAQYPDAAGLTVVALQIGDSMLPIITLAALILFTTRSVHPLIRFFIAPAVGLLASLTTFFRGSVLNYFVSLGATADRREPGGRPSSHVVGAALVAIGVVLFLGYGVVRNAAVLAAQHEQEARASASPSPSGGTGAPASASPVPTVIPAVTGEAVDYEAARILRGEGLLGIASIVAYYPSHQGFLGGQTIRDMLLLPVPRSIWHDKPAWYGIAQITRGEGEPDTTQSAVTIPGELYANFGPVGLAGTLFYGMLFGFFHRQRNGRRFRYAYAAILLPLVFVTYWMSTTGLINGLLPLAPAAVVLFAVFPPRLGLDRLRATRLRSASA